MFSPSQVYAEKFPDEEAQDVLECMMFMDICANTMPEFALLTKLREQGYNGWTIRKAYCEWLEER
jgi:hypothetical protein